MTDEKPIRPRKTWDSQFTTFEPRAAYKGHLEGAYHRKFFPDDRMGFAMQIIERFALIAGKADGEDSAGRQKGINMTPAEVVAFACDTSEHAFAEFEKRGWMVPMPSIDEQEEAARENFERN